MNSRKSVISRNAFIFMALLTTSLFGLCFSHAKAQASSTIFAVIGDFGTGNSTETSVANLVKSWNPDFIITTGDNYYISAGGTDTTKYDNSTGKDYCPFLAGITTAGTYCPAPGPAAINRFFPTSGNHDYLEAGMVNNLPAVYTSYFDLPGNGVTGSGTSGNERYYDFVQGPIHFFSINSNPGSGQEPDGVILGAKQANWLKEQLAQSTSRWNIVYFHHPPYSSGLHGSSGWMQWPFANWGADVILSGHDHLYERISRDGIVYFVNGAGGASLYECGTPVTGSKSCLSTFGAQKVTATDTTLTFEFFSIDGTMLDTFTMRRSAFFEDVPVNYWALDWIDRLYLSGITSGCAVNPSRYCPSNLVTRAEMAVFLERGIHGSNYAPPVVPITFGDTDGHWAQYWIEAFFSDGITAGCGNGNFCPNNFTTRAEIAVFLLRARHGSDYTPPDASGMMFGDVPASHWAAGWIEQLAVEGITAGCGNGNYCPTNLVSRAEMAVFLVKTFNLP